MTLEEETLERMKTGIPVFMELFKLPSNELKEKIRDIVGQVWFDERCSGMLKNGTVKKTLVNDMAKTIQISFYDSIEINYHGIWWQPEHGNQKCIKEFDKYFKL